jgi:hypothetical protein
LITRARRLLLRAKNYDEKFLKEQFLKRNFNRITNGNTSNSFGQKK